MTGLRIVRLAFAGLAGWALFAGARESSFASFDRRAKAGEPMTVVFFGGSLTWGANASDPQLTSYRGRMMSYLRARYPRAPLAFYDASIGGTGSDLGVFRLDRDVLSREPDLVFLDFMANDNYAGTDRETCCFYETLLRRMIREGVAVEQMYFGFKGQFGAGYDLAKAPRRTAYRRLAEEYRVAEGDLFPVMQAAATNGTLSPDAAWPIDGGHPGDAGYGLFFEAARNGFESAVRAGLAAHVPAVPVFGEVTGVRRIRLADGPLPVGWNPMRTYRTALWFDGQSSRWMGDVAGCDAKDGDSVQPLTLAFSGNVVGLFGESNENGLDVHVRLDGRTLACGGPDETVWPFRHRFGQGNLFIWRRTREPVAVGAHALELSPALPKEGTRGQLRIESVCVATLAVRGESASPAKAENE
ncbi:MAG: GDSL-type esterase/lipase family protein [Kiritimatiellia bacterium]|nr:GDSL-type esterase/lipase family protein [Kiritimatiellia bacterium]